MKTNLHKEFVRLAFDINKMKNKLMSLLLEIHKHKIYEKHGCLTIYEYGFKYARLSKEVVQKALRTMKHLEDKPHLKGTIESEGIHKVALVATIATEETDEVFAKHVRNMSKPALAEFARELREKMEEGKMKDENVSGENLFGTSRNAETEVGTIGKNERGNRNEFTHQQRCRASAGGTKIEMDAKTEALFLQLKKKYAKDSSNKYALKILLRKLAELEGKKSTNPKNFSKTQNLPKSEAQAETAKKPTNGSIEAVSGKNKKEKDVPGNVRSHKQQPAANSSTSQKDSPGTVSSHKTNFESRYIRAHQKKNLLQKYSHTCAYPNCANPHDIIHHRTPFSVSRTHEDIIPLCKIHHEFAHNGLIAHERKLPAEWRLNVKGGTNFVNSVFAGKKLPT